MKRRQFTRSLAGLAALSSVPLSAWKSPAGAPKDFIKPARPQKGDTIGLISPASPLREGQMEEAIQQIEDFGFRPYVAPHAGRHFGYLAGTDDERLSDLHHCFENGDVDAIWCLRGGYGLTRLLPRIDFEKIRSHPKAVIGYSDITALHMALFVKAGLISFHGPVLTSDYNDYVLRGLDQTLFQPEHSTLLKNYEKHSLESPISGRAIGRLVGGNLTLLAAMCGTPFLPDLTGKIVFLEDIKEEPYRIDRMLTQLVQAAHLNQAAGIVLGHFRGCEKDEGDAYSLTLDETFQLFFDRFRMPVLRGLSFGHIEHQLTLPHGIYAELDADRQQLKLLEKGVAS